VSEARAGHINRNASVSFELLLQLEKSRYGANVHVVGARPQVTESLGKVGSEEGLEEIFGERLKVGGVADFAGDDLLIELHRVPVFGEEGRVASLLEQTEHIG
jgi:hypothetical protein